MARTAEGVSGPLLQSREDQGAGVHPEIGHCEARPKQRLYCFNREGTQSLL